MSISLSSKSNSTFTFYRNGTLIRVKILVNYRSKRTIVKRWKTKARVVKRFAGSLVNWKCCMTDSLVDDVNLLEYVIENSNWFLFEKAEDSGIFELKNG